jgi:hypothetical protein
VIAIRVFMTTTNYADTSSAVTRHIAEFGYAKRIRQTAVLALLCHSPTAKRVATTRHILRTTMQLPTFDVYISALVRTVREVLVKSGKKEVV